MNYVTKVAAKSTSKKTSEIGILINASSLRARLNIDESAQRLARFIEASVDLMKLMARGCGYNHLNRFSRDDITSWNKRSQN